MFTGFFRPEDVVLAPGKDHCQLVIVPSVDVDRSVYFFTHIGAQPLSGLEKLATGKVI